MPRSRGAGGWRLGAGAAARWVGLLSQRVRRRCCASPSADARAAGRPDPAPRSAPLLCRPEAAVPTEGRGRLLRERGRHAERRPEKGCLKGEMHLSA